MVKEIVKLIDQQIELHTRSIINYQKMRLVANQNTAFMDGNQKKEYKKKMLDIMTRIKKIRGEGDCK